MTSLHYHCFTSCTFLHNTLVISYDIAYAVNSYLRKIKRDGLIKRENQLGRDSTGICIKRENSVWAMPQRRNARFHGQVLRHQTSPSADSSSAARSSPCGQNATGMASHHASNEQRPENVLQNLSERFPPSVIVKPMLQLALQRSKRGRICTPEKFCTPFNFRACERTTSRGISETKSNLQNRDEPSERILPSR